MTHLAPFRGAEGHPPAGGAACVAVLSSGGGHAADPGGPGPWKRPMGPGYFVRREAERIPSLQLTRKCKKQQDRCEVMMGTQPQNGVSLHEWRLRKLKYVEMNCLQASNSIPGMKASEPSEARRFIIFCMHVYTCVRVCTCVLANVLARCECLTLWRCFACFVCLVSLLSLFALFVLFALLCSALVCFALFFCCLLCWFCL